MPGDFAARIDELIEQTGDGALIGSVVVDQIYARIQHERLDFKHPQGGQAKYLVQPLMQRYHLYLNQLARAVLGGDLPGAMADAMEDLSQQVFEKAPREFWDLRESGHPMVNDGNTLVYDRAPLVHRLSEGELAVKDRLRARGLGGGA